MTRKSAVILIGLVSLAAAGSAQPNFSADLSAAQVVGGTDSTATGTAKLTLSDDQSTLAFSIVLLGLDWDGNQTPMDSTDNVTAMHFHNAPIGANNPPVFGLKSPVHDLDDLVVDPVAGTITGIWDENPDVPPLSEHLDELLAEGLYLNVHTTEYPGGAIRGQVQALLFYDGFESGNTLIWSSTVP